MEHPHPPSGEPAVQAPPPPPPPRARLRVVLGKAQRQGVAPGAPASSTTRCHVCGELGHSAGFLLGAAYQDCVSTAMACYLCKRHGHTTQTCPHRIKPGAVPAAAAAAAAEGRAALLGGALPPRWGRLCTLPLARETSGGLAAAPAACRSATYRAVPSRYRGGRWRVEAAVLRLHSRRIAQVSFHPVHTDRLVCADKSGELSVWRYEDPRRERSVWAGAHKWLINALAWVGAGQPNTCLTASADGTLRLLDVESRHSELLCDLNPSGWTGVESQWRMFYACAAPPEGSHVPLLAGDDLGRVWALDPRHSRRVIGHVQAHKRGGKVQSLQHNPQCPELVVSAGNDHLVKLWDVRRLAWQRDASLFSTVPRAEGGDAGVGGAPTPSEPAASLPAAPTPRLLDHEDEDEDEGGGGEGAAVAVQAAAAVAVHRRGGGGGAREREAVPLGTLAHPRVVTSAVFSPLTGSRLLTTCIDNRLRVWDHLHRLGSGAADPPPTSVVVHSHDFARYLSPFKAVFDPKDHEERTVVCGRYISEPFAFGPDSLPLHPIDVLQLAPRRGATSEASSSSSSSSSSEPVRTLQQLVDPLLPTISPVVAVHPSQDVIACGSSRSVYVWKPISARGRHASSGAASAPRQGRSAAPRGDSDDDSDHGGDDDDGDRAAASRPVEGDDARFFMPPAASSTKRGGSGKAGKVRASALSASEICALAQRRFVVLAQGPSDAAAPDAGDSGDDSGGEGPGGPRRGRTATSKSPAAKKPRPPK